MFTFASFILPNSIYCRWDSIILSVVSSSSWLVVMVESLHGKLYFLFPDVLKRWSCAGVWSFSYYWERSCFSFLKTFSFSFFNPRWKMKDDLFQKNTRKYDIVFRPPEKKVFSRRIAPGHDLSCIIWKDGIFFPKTWCFFSLGRKGEMTFLNKYMEIWYFLCTRTGVTNVTPRPSVKKIKDGLILQKYT